MTDEGFMSAEEWLPEGSQHDDGAAHSDRASMAAKCAFALISCEPYMSYHSLLIANEAVYAILRAGLLKKLCFQYSCAKG